MANGKTKKQVQRCGNSVAKKNVEKIVGDPLWDGEKKQKKAGNVPARPRRLLPPITPHKERCKYVHIAEYESTG